MEASFEDDQKMMEINIIILVTALSVVSIVCFASNLLVCFAICLKRTTKSFARYFIFSLAVTDLIIGTVAIPFYAWLEANKNKMAPSTYDYYAIIFDCIDAALNFSSVVHLCIMSIDRAVAAAKPLYHRRYSTQKLTLRLLSLPWIIATICFVPYVVAEKTNLLYFVYFITLTVVFYLTPIVVISICYAIIFRTVKRRNKSRLSGQRLDERKLTRTIIAVVIVFLICWTPFVCLNGYVLGVAFVTGERPKEHWYYVVIKLVSYLNSAINPYIYVIFHDQFRKAFIDIIHVCKETSRGSQDFDDTSGHKEANV